MIGTMSANSRVAAIWLRNARYGHRELVMDRVTYKALHWQVNVLHSFWTILLSISVQPLGPVENAWSHDTSGEHEREKCKHHFFVAGNLVVAFLLSMEVVNNSHVMLEQKMGTKMTNDGQFPMFKFWNSKAGIDAATNVVEEQTARKTFASESVPRYWVAGQFLAVYNGVNW